MCLYGQILHDDGYSQWSNNVQVLYIQKLLQFVGDELVYAYPLIFCIIVRWVSFWLNHFQVYIHIYLRLITTLEPRLHKQQMYKNSIHKMRLTTVKRLKELKKKPSQLNVNFQLWTSQTNHRNLVSLTAARQKTEKVKQNKKLTLATAGRHAGIAET